MPDLNQFGWSDAAKRHERERLAMQQPLEPMRYAKQSFDATWIAVGLIGIVLCTAGLISLHAAFVLGLLLATIILLAGLLLMVAG